MKNKKFIVLFAGPAGSSKTPIAYYLSWNFGLPIINNDSIRTEVTEDLGALENQEYLRRRDERLQKVLEIGKSIIYDASVDRGWQSNEEKVVESGFEVFTVSLDLSKDFLEKLYEAKGYKELDLLNSTFIDHEKFLERFGNIINVHITDRDFPDRLQIVSEAFAKWLNT